MKKLLIAAFILGIGMGSKAQSHETEQLLLNFEKLKQLKNMLEDMKQGYRIVSKGYNAIKGLSEGNFNLHEAFFNNLLAVNPLIRNYWRVGEIINHQKSLIKEYKLALKAFSKSGTFNVKELDYHRNVYQNLLTGSTKSLDELITVITASKLSMNDSERLAIIDRIYADSVDKLQFLRSFNRNSSMLMMQRIQSQNDITHIQKLHSIK
ncbi:TerB family tellurite resistance protein [Pedobacter puniceum]|uniref:TerB family tellurite resistance protein n=1 Tax=Pedobacter puniceum TaxID=2666136 RepID=A0A7K0FLV4_9SPHI|nr:TerB family tellurite resistance protein [Pedobacter puniceum]MRX46954.1 TerB family tellurite resistance protein [Pedobacter puniceum]